MKTVNGSDAAAQLNDLLDAIDKDRILSILVRSEGRHAAMLLNATIAQSAILGAYLAGVLSRTVAMRLFGLDWYGRPPPSPECARHQAADRVEGGCGANDAINAEGVWPSFAFA